MSKNTVILRLVDKVEEIGRNDDNIVVYYWEFRVYLWNWNYLELNSFLNFFER